MDMDLDTMILMIMTVAAFFWWVGLRIQEDRQYARELVEQEKEKEKREERVRLLYNRR